MLVREAAPADAAALSTLSAELGYPVSMEIMRQRLTHLPSDHAVFVAQASTADDEDVASSSEVVGWIDVGLSFHLQTGSRAEIGGLVVAAEARSRGIGRQLLQRAEQWARQHGSQKVLLRSNIKRTDAHRFYDREHYRQIKTSAVFEKEL